MRTRGHRARIWATMRATSSTAPALADAVLPVGAGVDEDGEGIPVADLRWGDFFRPALGGRTGRFLSYVTPQVGGFEAAASVGQPQDITFVKGQQGFEDRTNGLVTDAALRYRGDWGPFRVLAG